MELLEARRLTVAALLLLVAYRSGSRRVRVGSRGRAAVLVEKRILGEFDIVSTKDVRGLASIEGPCLSVFMPSNRHGPETLQGPVRLRNLIERAANDLRAPDFSQRPVDDVLASPRVLLDDAWFWQHQGDGLALLAAPGFGTRYRLPASVAEELVVAAWT